ncbi:MAG: alpha-1,2-fucosyltransferase [Lachnospiraceae bacterium]|jgi:hypothetical protein|nr:alpha-1,2-fucosyltransferase [Lachnospiraceae bacterium]
MIIVEAAGGLGNQLQQYALYRKFLHLGREARLDTSWFGEGAPRALELDYLDGVAYTACTPAEKKLLFGTKLRRRLLPRTVAVFQESEIFHPEIFGFTDMYIRGYFACEAYYADILPKLRFDLRFRASQNPRNHVIVEEMRTGDSVAVHIRRGDYLTPDNQELFGGICTDAYYKASIDYISQRHPRAKLYYFSDDSGFIHDKFTTKGRKKPRGDGLDFEIVDWNQGADSIYDMCLMSNCKHIVCANSTFSFWGGRLAANPEKIIIRPARHKNTQTIAPAELLPLWPGWVLVDSEGRVFA